MACDWEGLRSVALRGESESGWALGPLRGAPPDAGTTAVYEHHVAVPGVDLVKAGGNRARVSDVLVARDRDQRARGQVGASLAVLPRTDEVAGFDGRRGQVTGPARVATAPEAPDFAVLGAGTARRGRRACLKASRRSPRLRALG